MCEQPPTNVEMADYVHSKWAEHYAKVDRDGCCGGTIREGGICPETGRLCPLYRQAMTIEEKTFAKETL